MRLPHELPSIEQLFKFKGAKGDGGAKELRAAQDKATQALIEGRDQGYRFLDTAQQQGLEDINPLLPQARKITQGAFDNIANYDQNVAGKVATAQDAYMKPAQRQVDETLKNLFRSGGVGGSNNSKFQNFVARQGEEASMQEALRRYQLEQQVKDDYMQEQQGLYGFGAQPIQYKSGVVLDTGKAKANTAVGAGSQLSNVYMGAGQGLSNIEAQNQARRQSSKGTMAGAATGGIGSIAGMFANKK